MFWRGDPRTKGPAPSNDNWPRYCIQTLLLYKLFKCVLSSKMEYLFLYLRRNGSILKGMGPYNIDGEEWLKVSEIKQAGTKGKYSKSLKKMLLRF